MFQPSRSIDSIGVRLSTGALACTTDSNWQFFRCCPVIKACIDSSKHKDKRSSDLKKALVANNTRLVADALEKEKFKVKCLNRRLTFSWKEMYTLHITPLCIAVFYRNLDIISLLLKNDSNPKRGGEIYLRNSWKRCTVVAKLCPFLLALEDQPDSGCPFVPEVASMLLDAGADINSREGFVFREQEEEGGSMEFDNKITPLHFFSCRHTHANFSLLRSGRIYSRTENANSFSSTSQSSDSQQGEVEGYQGNVEGSPNNNNEVEEVSRGKKYVLISHYMDNSNKVLNLNDLGAEICEKTGSVETATSNSTLKPKPTTSNKLDNLLSLTNSALQSNHDDRSSSEATTTSLQLCTSSENGNHYESESGSCRLVSIKSKRGKETNMKAKGAKQECRHHNYNPLSEVVFYFLLEKGADMLALDSKGRTPLEGLLENLASSCHQSECSERMLIRALELIRRGGFLRGREHLRGDLDWYTSEFALAAAASEDAKILLMQFLDCGYVCHKEEQQLVSDYEFVNKFGSDLAERLSGHWVPDLKHHCQQFIRGLVCRHCCKQDTDCDEKLLLNMCCVKKLERLPLPKPLVDFVSLKPQMCRLK